MVPILVRVERGLVLVDLLADVARHRAAQVRVDRSPHRCRASRSWGRVRLLKDQTLAEIRSSLLPFLKLSLQPDPILTIVIHCLEWGSSTLLKV